MTVHDIWDHGIYVDGQHVVVEGSTIYLANMNNEGGSAGAWGSALKVRVGGEDIILRGNTIYHNWGEGIGVTRGVNVVVEDNEVYDNFAVNLYIDNSRDVVVDGNFVHCDPGSGWGQGGRPAPGIGLGEEEYEGWGAQLRNVTIRNNIVGYCRNGVAYFGSDVGQTVLRDIVIAHNTVVGTPYTPIWLDNQSAQGTTMVVNNLLQRDGSGEGLHLGRTAGIVSRNNLTDDPGFATTPGYTADSYRLGAGSAAIDAGIALPDALLDFLGRSRDARPDLGAIEYGP
jgi:hypothetical protein